MSNNFNSWLSCLKQFKNKVDIEKLFIFFFSVFFVSLFPCQLFADNFELRQPSHHSKKPLIGKTYSNDRDGNGLEDQLEAKFEKATRKIDKAASIKDKKKAEKQLDDKIDVELIFTSPIKENQLKNFEHLGGEVDYRYKAVSYGWNGRIPLRKLKSISASMGTDLVLVQESKPIEAHLDTATSNGRVRPVWSSGFAGIATGFKGTDDITIGIVDSGVDADHSDFYGRCVYWHDFSSDNSTVPIDKYHHGSHVAGIAAGSGVSGGSGPGTLYYTDRSIPFLTFSENGYLQPNLIHLPDAQVVFTSTAQWFGGAPTSLYLLAKPKGIDLPTFVNNAGWTVIAGPVTGYSPLTQSCTFTASSDMLYTTALAANFVDTSHVVGRFVIANSIENYPGAGDDFNKMSGVAPGCNVAASKVFTSTGSGYTSWLEAAVDDMVANRVEKNIKVMNLSIGIVGDPGLSPSLRQKINTAVSYGIVVVISAGNDGRESTEAERSVDDPGRAAWAITVAASNDENQLTDYTSQGFTDPNTQTGQEEDYKPDVMAPGGSIYQTYIMSVDSGSGDGGSFLDQQPGDYTQMRGTSMASPFIAGCAALVIDALEQNGMVWDFNSLDDPSLVKMILCATSSETNAQRENGLYNPTLERALDGPNGFPPGKDNREGYGLVNVDAAVEAVTQQYSLGSTVNETLLAGPYDKRVWARGVYIPAGLSFEPSLIVPDEGDFDLYLYNSQPGLYGKPIIVESSTNEGLGTNESLSFSPETDFNGFLVVKRITGEGEFSLTTLIPSQQTLTLSSTVGGTISQPGMGVFQYSYGTDVELDAVADPGYSFTEWSGTGVDVDKVQDPNLANTTIRVDSDYTAVANFTLNQYTVTALAGDNGTLDPVGEVGAAYGDDLLLTAMPDTGYDVDSWSVDGTEVQTGGTTYTLLNVTADHTVTVSFRPQSVIVTASAGANGSVDPNGVVTAAYGADQLFTALPDTGYTVDTWLVDGSPVQTGGLTYTLSNITADHTVAVNFKPQSVTITVSAGANGTVDPNGVVSAAYETDVLLTAMPDTGYDVDAWLLDGSPVQTGGLTYALSNITSDHTVTVSFRPQSVIVTVWAGTNGSVDPNGILTPDYGTDLLLTAAPDSGYAVDAWTVDGVEVQEGGTTYTLSNITADHAVIVSFKPLSITITVSAGVNGSVDPNGVVSAAYGADQLFTALPDTGYTVDSWLLDGTEVQTGGTTYTLLNVTTDHNVVVSFKPLSITITVSAGVNGSVDPNGVVTPAYGTDQLFTAVPDTGYDVDSWLLDGSPVQTGGLTYTLSDITADHTVTVTFIAATYTITASAGANGSVDPNGVVTAAYGADQLFTAVPDTGYDVDAWTVDGTTVQTGGLTYTLSDITADHTVAVNFKPLSITVTVSAGVNGSVDPNGVVTPAYGDDLLLTALPDSGYDVDSWLLDGSPVQTGGLTYTLSNIAADHTVAVTFIAATYTITVSSDANGSVDPNGVLTAAYGADQLFTAVPDTGYAVDAWLVDGTEVQTGGTTYTLSAVTTDHAVMVSFKPQSVTITVSASVNGSVDPNGVVTPAYGDDLLLTALPDSGYDVDSWLLDGSPVQTGGLTYTLSDITADHTVAVTFIAATYTITASAGANGSVDPNGVVSAAYGTDQLFTALPDTGYTVDSWLLDGSPVQTGGTTYTLSDITANHTVSVTFIAATYTVTVSAAANGSVDPNGVVSAAYGTDLLLTAMPDTGYDVDAWLVDGSPVQTGGLTYTLSDITADHAVMVSFKPLSITITVSAGANGMVDPNGVVTAAYGDDQLFTAVPDTGYDVDAWTVDGTAVQTGGLTYTLSDITADHTVAVNFKPLSVTITVSAGANGTVDPNGVVTAAYGADQLFMTAPDSGYTVDNWSVDGTEVQTGGTTYTLLNVTTDHNVVVSFKPLSITITVSAGVNGSVDPNGVVTPAYGADLLLTAVPDTGYDVDSWLLDGSPVQTGGLTYTLSDITADHTVTVTFIAATYTITASAGANGSVDPNGVVTAAYGTDQLFTALPDAGYDVDVWSVDGAEVQTGGTTYTLSNITADHAVIVSFKPLSITIMVSAGANGTVDPNGVVTAAYGDDLLVTATPDTGYDVDVWSVDGSPVQTGGTTYTLFNVAADHTVFVTFIAATYTITVSSDANGSVDPNGVFTAAYGADQLFTAVPDTGYDVDSWSVDGTDVQSGGTTYTLSDITADHSVMVSFKLQSITVTVSAGVNGSVDPNGVVTAAHGADQLFTAVPDSGYEVNAWTVDGADVQIGGTAYTLSNITADHTVAVSFKPQAVRITVSAGTNGSVDPNGILTPDYGTDLLLTAMPDAGYDVDVWSVDGAEVQTGGTTYTLSNIAADHAVIVSFKPLSITITVSAGANGTVDPNGVVTAAYGADQLFTAVPDTGYDVDVWSVNGLPVQTGGTTYTLFNVAADHMVSVTFIAATYTITVSSDANGSVDPNGVFTAAYGADQLFTAVPDIGYAVDAWLVDGTEVQTGGTTYTLSAVTTDHAVMVSFKPQSVTITVSAGANGSVDPNGVVTAAYGADQLFTAVPDSGYDVDSWLLDGSPVQAGGLTYTLSDIAADHTVTVTFFAATYTITASAGANGSVDPNGVVTAAYGADQLFTAAPDSGYDVDSWLLDGSPVQAGGLTYTLSDIAADHTVAVNFKPLSVTVTVSAGVNGLVDPNGMVTPAYGADVLLTATPDTGYAVDSWSVDGISVQTGGTTYTLLNITADHTVSVTFIAGIYTITVSTGANGSVDPNGVFTAAYGTDQLFTAVPDTGYAVDAWLVDGSPVQTGGLTYTLSDITTDHTVSVTFIAGTYTITASAGANGSVDPNGVVTAAYGADQLFTAVSDSGYEVDTWSVDGTAVQIGGLTYTLSDITADHAVTVTFVTLTPIISGYCIEPDGITPVEGVRVQTDSDVNSITDANGFYTLQVDYGWTGIVTPEKEGYIFDPNSDEFINVTQNYTDVNYIVSLITYRIEGTIFEQDLITPISDVCVTAENGGGSWVTKYGGEGGLTDENGCYELDVDYNWSGLVTPSKYAYAFDPNSRAYTNVLADQEGQGYTGEPMTFAISGQILNGCSVPIQGVKVNANNGGNQTVTDADGFYEVWVPYNWSGSVIPDKVYYTFDPNQVDYMDVLDDQTNQNYGAFNKYDLDCDGSIGGADFGVMADNWLDGTLGNICDFNNDMNVNYEDFTELAKAWLMK